MDHVHGRVARVLSSRSSIRGLFLVSSAMSFLRSAHHQGERPDSKTNNNVPLFWSLSLSSTIPVTWRGHLVHRKNKPDQVTWRLFISLAEASSNILIGWRKVMNGTMGNTVIGVSPRWGRQPNLWVFSRSNGALFSNSIGQTCPILTSKYGHSREQSSLILVTRIHSHRIAPSQFILPMHIFKHSYRYW